MLKADRICYYRAAAAPPAPVRAAPPLNAPTGPASFVASQQQSPPPGASPSAPLNGMSGALVAPGGFIPGGPGQGMPVPMRPQQPMLGPGGIPNFQTQQEAERAFMAMLKTIGVNASWTWEQVMRETITDPMYKALKTLAERKTAFEKYVVESKREEKEERERSLEEWRKEWFKGMEKIGGGLSMEGGVKSWWSWERGSKAMEAKNPEVWKGPRNDEERKTLFNEFIENLKKKEEVSRFVSLPPSALAKTLTLALTPTDSQARPPHQEHGQAHQDPPIPFARPRRFGSLARGASDHLPHPGMAPRSRVAED